MARPVLRPYQPKQRYIPKVQKHEQSLQLQVCQYLRLQYPSVTFRSDYASGLKLSIYQATQHKRLQSSRAWPDLFIYEPRTIENKHYCGLAIELKKEGTSVVLKTGSRKGHLSTNPHIQEQAAVLKNLIKKGFYADFGVGFDSTIKLIDWYMGRPENTAMF